MEYKKYQLSHVKNNLSFKRIVNEIKKIDEVFNASLDNDTRVLLIEYNLDSNELEKNIKSLDQKVLRAVHVYEKKAIITSIDNVEVFRKVLYLRGLDCAYCASRVESIAKREFNHTKIIVDYATTRFIIETSDKALVDNLETRVTEVAHKVDERIIVQSAEKGKPVNIEIANSFSKPKFFVFLTGILIFIVGIIISDIEFETPYLNTILGSFLIIIGFIMICYDVLIKFTKSIFKGRFLDENFLMTVASICALILQKYVEAALIMILYQLGDTLSNIAVNRTRKSIAGLLQFDVQNVKIVLGDVVQEIAVEGVVPDDVLIVGKGEMIPVDGKICEGKTMLDLKNITGESKLQSAELGSEVLSGSLNVGSQFKLRVTQTYNNSMMTKIMDLVENSTLNKARTENFVTKFAKVYTPIIVICAAAILFLGILFTILYKSDAWKNALNIVANFMVIACPCSVVISIPLSYFIAIGVASRRGILIRGSNYLEAFNKTETIVFDKTGTLTKGNFSIMNIVPFGEYTFEDVHRFFLYTEYYSEHPIGRSIVDAFGRDQFFTEIISDFRPLRGGARANINGSKILIANRKLASKEKLTFPEIDSPNLIIYVFKESNCIGYVEIGDSLREEAYETITQLRKNGINDVYMLTGDSKLIANDVANKLQIDQVYSELLPDEKVSYVEQIKEEKNKKHGTVCFVGDGVNDAPVISSADVGVALSDTASDITISISDIVIMSGDLSKLVDLSKIAENSNRVVVFNIIFSLFTKILVMFLAVGLAESVHLPMWVSILADVGVCLLCVGNALLLFFTFKKPSKKERKRSNE